MVDIVFDSNSLTVFGPPASLDVEVDIGPQGQRGSKIFAGLGNPNVNPPVGSVQLNDLYINASPGTDYAYLYQYISQPGGDTWTSVLKINPVIYSDIVTANFTTGTATLTIPLSNILNITGTPPTASNFAIQPTIQNADPTACSISSVSLVNSNTDLQIVLKAVKSSSGTWSNLTGEVSIHLFISMIS